MQPEATRTVRSHLDRFLEHLRVRSMSPRTIESYRSHLDGFAAFLTAEAGVEKIDDVTPEILFRYQTYLYVSTGKRGRGLAIATQAARLSAVRSLCRHLVQTDALRFDPASALTLPKRKHLLPRAILSKREVTRLLRSPDTPTALGLRDRAMLEVLYSTGIRNAELRRLKLADVDLVDGLLHINEGKGGQPRVVPVGKMACGALEAYLRDGRSRLLRADENEQGKLNEPHVEMTINPDLIFHEEEYFPSQWSASIAKGLFEEAAHGLDIGSNQKSAEEAWDAEPRFKSGTEPRMEQFEQELRDFLANWSYY